MSPPVLYSFRRCPYAIRARMALARAGIPYTLREISFRDKPAHMLRLSPKGTVPVLCLPDGRVIDESLDIMQWALTLFDPDGWLDADRPRTQALIQENDTTFKQALDRYKYHVRYPAAGQVAYRTESAVFLAKLEASLYLNQGKGLVDLRITLADIAIFPFVRQCAGVDRAWFDATPYLLLQQWLCQLESWPGFTAIMCKYPV